MLHLRKMLGIIKQGNCPAEANETETHLSDSSAPGTWRPPRGGYLSDPLVLPFAMSLSHAVYTLDSQCYLLTCYLQTEKEGKYFSPTPHTGNCFPVSLVDFIFG